MKKIYILTLCIILINNLFLGQAYANSLSIRVSPKTIDFHIEDANGRISGYTDTQLLLQIPYLDNYGEESAVGEENPTEYQQWNRLYSSNSKSQILPGKYKLILYGTNINKLTKIIIGLSIYSNGNSAIVMPVDYILPGLVYKYEFDITAIPADNNINFTKMANPQDIINEINVLAKLGYIGNQHFVSELIKEINEIEAEKAKGKIDDGMTPAQKAKKEYQELIKELIGKNEKPEKDEYINDLAFVTLKKDIEYIINHIQ